jgi:hypothetical protein
MVKFGEQKIPGGNDSSKINDSGAGQGPVNEGEKKVEIMLPVPVYFVEADNQDETVLVAMDVSINQQQKLIRWFDTIKDRLMYYSKIVDQDLNHFVFERGDKGSEGNYFFSPMTLDLYNKNVKAKLIQGKDFKTEEEMIAAFEKTKEQMW